MDEMPMSSSTVPVVLTALDAALRNCSRVSFL